MKLLTKIIIILLSSLLLTFCTADDDPNNYTPVGPNPIDTFQLAQITITTESAAPIVSKETYLNCNVTIRSDDEGWDYEGIGRIRGRGNSTWNWYQKKPYRFELNQKSDLLGMKAEKDWVLLANYRDPTHLMNTFVFIVGSSLKVPYTNNTRYVEVTLNENYIGLYQLTEQVEQGSNRVAIDYQEGLLLSLDADDGPRLSPDAGDNFWSSVYKLPVCVKHPDITSTSQLTNINIEFAQLENAIKSADYNSIEQLFDIKTFIDYMIIQELVYNVEVDAPRSIFIHRDKGGKWTMGPLWDFDAGYDFDWSTMYNGHNYFKSYKELVLGTDPVNHISGYSVPSFFTDLFRSKQFVSEYKARWLEVKAKIMKEYWATTQRYIDGISDALVRDATRWPIDKNNVTEIQRMQQWLNNRVGYLSNVIANYPSGTK